jgi:two-component sensor histidine kinase
VCSVLIIIYVYYKNVKKKNKKLVEQTHIINNKNMLLEKVVSEKDILIKEIHHRVKNNLQLVMCLLNIQSRKSNNEEVIDFIEKGQARITSMALIHQNLYNSENLSSVDFNEYVNQLINSIVASHGEIVNHISFKVRTNNINFDIQTGIPLGLIINELICNSLKYAFLNRKKGEIVIEMSHIKNDEYELSYSDDGVGYDHSIINDTSIGIKLVRLLTEQLKGSIIINNNMGMKYTITFKCINNN